jgi:hypothetical protein
MMPALAARRIVLDEIPTIAAASAGVTHVEASKAALRSSKRIWMVSLDGRSVGGLISTGSGTAFLFANLESYLVTSATESDHHQRPAHIGGGFRGSLHRCGESF